jgi:hypothetical protein
MSGVTNYKVSGTDLSGIFLANRGNGSVPNTGFVANINGTNKDLSLIFEPSGNASSNAMISNSTGYVAINGLDLRNIFASINATFGPTATGTYSISTVSAYTVYTFTGDGSFNFNSSGTTLNYIVVGGGGTGGSGFNNVGGGGGGGGEVKFGYFGSSGYNYYITVGTAGQPSSLGTTYTASAGGNGGNGNNGINNAGGPAGIAGTNGGNGGKGGSIFSDSANPGSDGYYSSSLNMYFGGGGGGGTYGSTENICSGGRGGGGNGGITNGNRGLAQDPSSGGNYGGGGGGGGGGFYSNPFPGAHGGKGVVILYYINPSSPQPTILGGSVQTINGRQSYVFTSSTSSITFPSSYSGLTLYYVIVGGGNNGNFPDGGLGGQIITGNINITSNIQYSITVGGTGSSSIFNSITAAGGYDTNGLFVSDLNYNLGGKGGSGSYDYIPEGSNPAYNVSATNGIKNGGNGAYNVYANGEDATGYGGGGGGAGGTYNEFDGLWNQYSSPGNGFQGCVILYI